MIKFPVSYPADRPYVISNLIPLPVGMVQVGNSLLLNDNGSSPALAPLDQDNVAMWNSNTDLLEKYNFDGTNWSLVGNGLLVSTNGCGLAGLGVNRVATCTDFGVLQVYDFDGTNWAAVGNAGAVGFPPTGNYMVALSPTEIAVAVTTGGGQLRVYEFDGTDWTNTGTNLNVAAFGSNGSLARLDGDNIAIEGQTLDQLRTYRRSAGVWSQAGSDLGLSVANPTLCGLSDKRIIHADSENDQLRIYDFNDYTTWTQVGNSLSVGAITVPPTVATMTATRIAYYDGTNGVGRELRAYDLVF